MASQLTHPVEDKENPQLRAQVIFFTMTEDTIVADVGGTTIKLGFFRGEELAEQISFRQEEFENPVSWLAEVLERRPGASEKNWVIGVPGSLEEGRYIRETPNLTGEWAGAGIARSCEEVGIKFQLENDANLAALGEATYGAARKWDSAFCFTLGTGVGGGIIVENKLYRGATGGAAEVGHLLVEPEGRRCGCGNYGCLEAHASATALKKIYKENTGQELASREIFERMNDDRVAGEAVREMSTYLGRGVAQVINLLEPEGVVFAGGLSRDLDLMLDWLKEGCDPHIFAERAKNTPMVRCEREEPALYGGLALAVEQRW